MKFALKNCVDPNSQTSEMIFDGKCSEAGCDRKSLDYQVPESQFKALINSSERCEQYIRFDCFLAPLKAFGKYYNGYWSSFEMTELTRTEPNIHAQPN